MLIVYFAIFVCILITMLLLLKAGLNWFVALSLTFFALMISGEERINFAFARENYYFFLLGFNYLVILSTYFYRVPEEPTYILGTPVKQFRNRPLFASGALVLFGFAYPPLFYNLLSWRTLGPEAWALILLSFYMGVVGILLFRQAQRVRKLRLELQELNERNTRLEP